MNVPWTRKLDSQALITRIKYLKISWRLGKCGWSLNSFDHLHPSNRISWKYLLKADKAKNLIWAQYLYCYMHKKSKYFRCIKVSVNPCVIKALNLLHIQCILRGVVKISWDIYILTCLLDYDIHYFCTCRLKMLLHSTISGQSIIVWTLIHLKWNTQNVPAVYY